MTQSTPAWNELNLAERPAVELLQSLGYRYVAANELENERSSLKETILAGRLATALMRLNPWLSRSDLTTVVRLASQVQAASLAEANEKLYTSLTHGIAVEQDSSSGRKSRTVRFIDFDDPSMNELIVTRQYKVRGSKKHIIPDVVAFINGLPISLVECKSPTTGDTWRAEAIKQLHRYQEFDARWKNLGAPRLFETVQILIGTCGEQAVYGTVGTSARFYFDWKEPYPLSVEELSEQLGRAPTRQDILIYGLLEPRNLLDIIRNFVAFEIDGGRTIRKLARNRQFIAVNKALDRIRIARTPVARGGVVWHTQGSGKSLTMLWLALKLRRDETLQQPTIVIVTDRTKLDQQIVGVFEACGFPNPMRAESVRDLRRILEHPTGKTVMTTIQKFQEIVALGSGFRQAGNHPVLSSKATIFVMVDEAHRTQYQSLAANMRQALPNACFLGFTGTPIDKKDRSTLQTFGPYIDTYTIAQAVDDRATVPIRYESRLLELRVVGPAIDQVFERVFADKSVDERVAIRRKYANAKAIAIAPHRIQAICLDIIDHYTQVIAPNRFKAQIVTTSREAAVAYKEKLDELNAPESALIMSAGHNDELRLARWHLNKHQQDMVIERFKDRDDLLSILVVCDMLLTGFDVPVEQVMYLDAPLKEHALLQAIARVNRPYGEDKTYGLIVDYWGVSEGLKEALAMFDSRDIRGALVPIADELPRLERLHGAAMKFFDSVGDKEDLEACVLKLGSNEVRTDFDLAFRRFAKSMDMVLPNPRANRFRADMRWLGKVRGVARARYRDSQLDLMGCGEKVRKMIADSIVADGMEILVEEVELFSPKFDEKLQQLESSEAKASEMEHAIRHEISVRVEQNPQFYQSLRQRLEEIIEQRRQERLDAAVQLSLLRDLREDLKREQEQAENIGLAARGYAIYGLLQKARPSLEPSTVNYDIANRDLAALIDDAVGPFTKLVDWHHKENLQREMRKQIKRRLRGAGIDEASVEALAGEIVDLAKVRAE